MLTNEGGREPYGWNILKVTRVKRPSKTRKGNEWIRYVQPRGFQARGWKNFKSGLG